MYALPRRPIPPIAWLLTAGTAIALVALVIPMLHVHGTDGFFERAHDSLFYRFTAQSPFGTGRAFVHSGNADEIAYRYGRIGLPMVSWLLAIGQSSLVPWTLIVVNLAAIAAVPGLSAALAAEYDAPPIAGAARPAVVDPLHPHRDLRRAAADRVHPARVPARSARASQVGVGGVRVRDPREGDRGARVGPLDLERAATTR